MNEKQIGPREVVGRRNRWHMSESGAPGVPRRWKSPQHLHQVASVTYWAFGAVSEGRWVGVMDTYLSTSAPVPGVSAPGSASAVPPAAGNPLLEGARSAERGWGE